MQPKPGKFIGRSQCYNDDSSNDNSNDNVY
jgi:hypothetical protein